MGNALSRVEVPVNDPGVRAAQARLDSASQVWVEVGIDAGLLVASLNPVGGQVADGISLARNVATGNYVDAIVDGVGFIPVWGDLFKGFFRGRKIRRAVREADEALEAARTALSRAQEVARRRMAASQYWGVIKRRRDEIKDAYRRCNSEACKEARRRELEQTTRLPSRQQGERRNADGSPALPGEGAFVTKEGTPMHTALERHQQPVTGVPFKDGQPDLSGFPPLRRSGAAPDGKAYSVEIEQSLSGDRIADVHAAWEQRAIDYPHTRNPSNGQWHHTGDGVTMQYVDEAVHGSVAHQGGVAMNTSPEY